MRQYAAAALRFANIDAAELGTGDARDAIEPCEPLVEECVVAFDEVENACVPRYKISDKKLCFSPHRMAQAFVEIHEAVAIGFHHVDIFELKPLAREVFNQRFGFLSLQHAADLRVKNGRLAQAAFAGHAQQFRVGSAAPKEIGKPRGKFEFTGWRKRCPRGLGVRLLNPE